MNIKKIYPVIILSAIISVAARTINILFGCELPSGLSEGNFFSYIFLIAAALSFFLIFFVSKFSYGVSKLSELSVSDKPLCLAFILMGLGFSVDSYLLVKDIEALSILDKVTAALGILSAVASIIFGIAVLKNSKRSIWALMVAPIIYYSVSLIRTFFITVSSISSSTVGVLSFKIIFILLFFISLISLLSDPEGLSGAGGGITYGAFSVVFIISIYLPAAILYFVDKQKYGVLLKDLSAADLPIVFLSLIFISAITKAVANKSNSLKAKVSEEL